jgi:mono/diheme cytochrome c family protein
LQRLTEGTALAVKPIARLVVLALMLMAPHAVPQTLVLVPLHAVPPLQVQAQSAPGASRGELLYRNHCIACHSTSVHWRDRRLVTDFGTLIAQVGRWEKNTGLGWSSEEILDVVQYLNATIYRFPDRAPLQKG